MQEKILKNKLKNAGTNGIIASIKEIEKNNRERTSKMEIEKAKGIIEAILFACGREVNIKELMSALE